MSGPFILDQLLIFDAFFKKKKHFCSMLLCAIFCQWHMYRNKNIIVQIKHAFDNLKNIKFLHNPCTLLALLIDPAWRATALITDMLYSIVCIVSSNTLIIFPTLFCDVPCSLM